MPSTGAPLRGSVDRACMAWAAGEGRSHSSVSGRITAITTPEYASIVVCQP